MEIHLTRGPVVESVHRVEAVVVDGAGGIRRAWGDPGRRVIARSSLKFVQAVPLLRTGAAEAYGVDDVELALACASHSAEADHVARVGGWLARLGLGPEALECGPDLPLGEQARQAALAQGRGPEAIFNCCSGKHAGFLTVARHLGADPEGYIRPDHPVQKLVTEAVSELCRFEPTDPPGIDGCGIPTFAIPLEHLAGAMARLATAAAEDESVDARAARRLCREVPPNTWWLAGTDRTEVALVAAASEPLLVKSGAEGVFMAGLPARGLGVALKVIDGAARAAEAAVQAVLADLGVIPASMVGGVVRDKAGRLAGEVRVLA